MWRLCRLLLRSSWLAPRPASWCSAAITDGWTINRLSLPNQNRGPFLVLQFIGDPDERPSSPPRRMPTLRSGLTTTAAGMNTSAPTGQQQPPAAPDPQSTAPPQLVEGTLPLRLPPYWAHDPQLWFAQIDAQFAARNIVSQVTKYGYVIGVLPAEVAAEIRDIILQPPCDNPYNTLKSELIARTTMSAQRRLQQLLTNEELGDQKPTQLLRRMRALVGDATLDHSLLQELFLQRLPPETRRILAASAITSLDDLAKLADRIIDLSPPAPRPVAAVNFQPENCYDSASASAPPAVMAALTTTLQGMNAAIANLTAMVAGISVRDRSPARDDRDGHVGRPRYSRPRRSRSRPRFQRRPPSPTSTNPSPFCWYHYNYGAQARRCDPPCAWPGNDHAGN